jgi:predicted transcriptional regulator
MSIRALSKDLERDYKSVHGDVSKLMELGLIIKRDDGKIEAPYDRIISDIRMAAA